MVDYFAWQIFFNSLNVTPNNFLPFCVNPELFYYFILESMYKINLFALIALLQSHYSIKLYCIMLSKF